MSANTQHQIPAEAAETLKCAGCGGIFAPIGKGLFVFRPKLCPACSGREYETHRLSELRKNHRDTAGRLRKRIEDVLPLLFRKARLKHLPKELCDVMLGLPDGKGLLLYGPPRVGKSYAMAALMRHYILRGFTAERISYDMLCLQIRDTYKPASKVTEQDIIIRYQRADKLLIEDIGTTVGAGRQETDFSLRTFLLILDYRLENRKPIFITTNKCPEQLGRSFDLRVAGRLQEACVIVPVAEDERN
jgi:DNA replication protein DnaC